MAGAVREGPLGLRYGQRPEGQGVVDPAANWGAECASVVDKCTDWWASHGNVSVGEIARSPPVYSVECEETRRGIGARLQVKSDDE